VSPELVWLIAAFVWGVMLFKLIDGLDP